MKRGLAAILTIALAVGAYGQIPNGETCMSALRDIGLSSLQSSLTPCAFSASESCCSNINNIVAIGADSLLGGCLCNFDVLEDVVGVIEGNSLAKAVGFDRARLLNVLDTCGTDFAGTLSCSSSSSGQQTVDNIAVDPSKDSMTSSGMSIGDRIIERRANARSEIVQTGGGVVKAVTGAFASTGVKVTPVAPVKTVQPVKAVPVMKVMPKAPGSMIEPRKTGAVKVVKVIQAVPEPVKEEKKMMPKIKGKGHGLHGMLRQGLGLITG